jgi:outer membrane protein OmpA-like peptidoglycan-associated protein
MKLTFRKTATAAFAVFLVPALNLFAGGPTKPASSLKDGNVVDSSSASVSGPMMSMAIPAVSLPAAPMPSVMLGAPMAALPYSGDMNSYTPRVELFLGYSYLRAVPTLATGNRLVWLNGGSTSIAFNLNRYLGIVGDFGGFDDTQLRLAGTSGSPTTVADSSGTVFTYLAGPRLSFRKYNRITPFAQVLFGDAHASAVTLSDCAGGGCTPLPTEDSFALTAGGGLDLRIRRHLAIRLIQAEYLMTRFKDLTTGNNTMQNDVRLSSGVVFRFGGAPVHAALAPLAYSCSVNPSAGFPGDRLAVSGTALNLNSAKSAVYTWTVDGGTISSPVSSTAGIDTTNVPAGTYTLRGHVTEGDKQGESADCSASYTLKAFEAPTVSCTASPASVTIGGSSAITATAISPQNRPLTYSYNSTGGSVSGTGPTASLSTAGTTPGPITISCNVVDDKGQTATATTPVTVLASEAAPTPVTSALCSVNFDRDIRRPSRVDNEAKACLDDIALTLQSRSDAKLALIGSTSNTEKAGRKLASERAANTKAYLVKEKGIDASRIAIYTGSQNAKTVSATLIPQGATLDVGGNIAVE